MATAWVGKRVNGGPGRQVILENPRILHAGLAKGSADLIGWVPVTITPDMVGQRLAVFASVEVKTGNTATTAEQHTWRRVVSQAGGLAAIVRDETELEQFLKQNAPVVVAPER